MKPKALLLDFDGVLSDSFSISLEEFNKIRTLYYPQIPEVKSQEDMAVVYAVQLRHSLFRFGLDEKDTRHFFDLHSSAMAKRAGEVEPFYKVVRVLAQVKIPIAIVTSSYSDVVHRILGKCKEYHPELLKAVLGRELHKTKTDKILHLLDLLNIDNDEAIYIGDLVSDVLYCRDVPIPVGAVGYGYHPTNYLKQFSPEPLLDTEEEFVEFLLSLT